MIISLIAAVSENFAIGKDKKLLWHLPADLKFFKEKTLGHCIIMGRKTFESVGKPLPGRRNIVITRNENWKAEGVEVVKSLEEALSLSKDDAEPMIVGGAEIYTLALPLANRIYLTQVEVHIEGDTFFPYISVEDWTVTSDVFHPKDEKNTLDFSFVQLDRK